MKSAKITPLSLRISVTTDHEFLASLAFDFDPVARAPADVAAVGFFATIPSNPRSEQASKKASRFHHVVAVVRLTEQRQEAFQELFSAY